MSELKITDILQITYQRPVDSFPLRENFEAIRGALNDEHRRVSALVATTPSGSEVTDARDYAGILLDRLQAVASLKDGLISGLAVSEVSTPDMTVYIGPGDAVVNGVYCRKGLGRTWARSGTAITITENSHGFTAASSVVKIEVSSDENALPLGEYTVAATPTGNTFTITGVNTGDTSGSADYGRFTAAITAPVANTRLDYVVINTDNTISVITGTAAAAPKFPAVAVTQVVLAALVVKSTTTSLNDLVEIFPFHHDPDRKLEDVYIGAAATPYQGAAVCNNLIINAAISPTVDYTAGAVRCMSQGLFMIRAKGWIYQNAAITPAAAAYTLIYSNANDGGAGTGFPATAGAGGSASSVGLRDYILHNFSGSTGGIGGQGGIGGIADVAGGGGGAGGSSFVSPGGAGAGGGYNGSGGTIGGDALGGGKTTKKMAVILIARDLYINANITATGATGNTGAAAAVSAFVGAGGGGSGGSSGSNVVLLAKNSLEITASSTISANGGAGGAGGASTSASLTNAGGGGGGGGAGGLILGRAKSLTNNGTQTVAGGAGGAGGAASGGSTANAAGDPGLAGTDGLVSIAVSDDWTTYGFPEGSPLPINSLTMSFLE